MSGSGSGSESGNDATRFSASDEGTPDSSYLNAFWSELLTPGALIGDRFRIVRFIARGGMGEVHEAEDLELGARVALKTLRPDVARSPIAVERLRREIHLARQVTHRNVCRIFDVFHHLWQDPSGEERVALGLSMELLAGQTLAQHIAAQGSLPTAEALPLIRQMAAGLSAAHDAGVVHRDLKSSNILLVPGNGDTRVVITDFGLARTTEAEPELASLTGSQTVVGTLAYMSPEQLEGEEVTPVSDLYSLGMVMYEMVTGTLPFKGSSALSNAVRRLQEAPPPPSVHVPDLPRPWEQTILRCLEHEPSQRFATAGEVVAALEGRTAPNAPRRGVRRSLWVAALAALILAAGAAVTLLTPDRRPAQPAAASSQVVPRPSVAVLGFCNLSGADDVAWISTALAEMLSTELAAGGELRAVSGENVARMRLELELPQTTSFAADTLSRIADFLDTDYVVLGSYLASGSDDGALRLDVRIQDTRSGQTVSELAQTARRSQLLELVETVGLELRDGFGLRDLSASQSSGIKAALPSTTAAARLYAQGLDALRRFDALAARDLLEQTIEADPELPLAHSALAEAWSRLGYDAKASAAARRALDLAAGLDEADRLLVEGRLREISGQWDAAIAVYERLWNLHPDTLEHGLRLAAVQRSAGRARHALATVRRLEALPGGRGRDPRVALLEAAAAGSLSDFGRQQEAARRAAALGDVLGARLVVAQARLEEGQAAWRLGEPESARAAFEAAQHLYQDAGDRSGVADCQRTLSEILATRGRLDEARTLTGQALAIYREIGNAAGTAEALQTLGDITEQAGDLEAATALYRQAQQICEEIGDLAGVSTSLNNLAIILWEQGDLDGALENYERSLAISTDTADASGVATTLNNIAVVLHDRGDLEAALRKYEEALAISRKIGEPSGIAVALNNIGELERQRGELESALQRYQESLGLRRQTGNLDGIETALYNIGEVYMEQLRLADARSHFVECLAICEQIPSVEGQALARSRLAQVLLEQGDTAAAETEVDRALALAARAPTLHTRGVTLITSGEVRLAGGNGQAAVGALREAVRLLAEHDDRAAAAQARLILAEALLATGHTAPALDEAATARQAFADLGVRDREGLAAALEGRARLVVGHAAAAASSLRSALEAAGDATSALVRASVLTAAASSQPDAAQRLRGLLADLESLGAVRLALRARLALAGLNGQPADRDELEAIRAEADQYGLHRIAEDAARAGR